MQNLPAYMSNQPNAKTTEPKTLTQPPENDKRPFNLTYWHLKESNKDIDKIYKMFEIADTKIRAKAKNIQVTTIAGSINARQEHDKSLEQFKEYTAKTLEQYSQAIDKIRLDFMGSKERLSSSDIIAVGNHFRDLSESEAYSLLLENPDSRPHVAQYLKAFSNGTKTEALANAFRTASTDGTKEARKPLEDIQTAIKDLAMSYEENLNDSVEAGGVSFYKTSQLLEEQKQLDEMVKKVEEDPDEK